MTITQLYSLVKSVLLSPQVIIITVAIALYINIVNYIVHYRKPPPATKKPRVSKAPPEKKPESEGEGEEDEDKIPKSR